jgi:transposase InsO family protein
VSRYRFIAAEQATYPIARLCRVRDVARSGYYAWMKRGRSARQQADQALTAQIGQVHTQSRGTYGAPRVHAALQAQGVRGSRKRVARLLHRAGSCGVSRRAPPRTTIADPTHAPVPNRLGRDFTVPGPNRVWVGDITYVPTGEGWRYLAVVLDACSRRVVGWALSDHLRTELPLQALEHALQRCGPVPGLLHHTDRGCQYTATAYQARLRHAGITPSKSRPGNCYDNALAESFFATFKTELLATQPWPTQQAARQAIFDWIEVFSNRQRLHSALGYCAPAAYEARMVSLAEAA